MYQRVMRFHTEERPGRRESYHHGNLREALIESALLLIAENGPAGAPPGPGGGYASRDDFRTWKRQMKGYFRHGWQQPQSSAPNSAFDDYRAETLRRLEEEQKEFQEYLERLRRARDKSEFDAFMAERGRYSPPPSPPPS